MLSSLTSPFYQLLERLAERKRQLPNDKLARLISQRELEEIYDFFLEMKDIVSASKKKVGKDLYRFFRNSMFNLQPGESLVLQKNHTQLPRTITIIAETGNLMLFVETKSKLADHAFSPHKQMLPLILGSYKRGKPCWRLDVEEEWFNLVTKIDPKSLRVIQTEVAFSQQVQGKEITLLYLGAKYSSSKNRHVYKISIYSLKKEYTLSSFLKEVKNASLFMDDLILDLLAGLKKFHDKGIVHQDIKPRNLLIEPNGEEKYQLKLTDYGLTSHAARGPAKATIGYESPEIAAYYEDPSRDLDLYNYFYKNPIDRAGFGTTVNRMRLPLTVSTELFSMADKANDMWAAGITIFEAYHGRRPELTDLENLAPLLKGLLALNRKQRFTVDEALEVHQKTMSQADEHQQMLTLLTQLDLGNHNDQERSSLTLRHSK